MNVAADAGQEVLIDGTPYVSANTAAHKHGYVRDYVARLCRQGKVAGRQLGRLWYVNTDSFTDFVRRNETFAASEAAHPTV